MYVSGFWGSKLNPRGPLIRVEGPNGFMLLSSADICEVGSFPSAAIFTVLHTHLPSISYEDSTHCSAVCAVLTP